MVNKNTTYNIQIKRLIIRFLKSTFAGYLFMESQQECFFTEFKLLRQVTQIRELMKISSQFTNIYVYIYEYI